MCSGEVVISEKQGLTPSMGLLSRLRALVTRRAPKKTALKETLFLFRALNYGEAEAKIPIGCYGWEHEYRIVFYVTEGRKCPDWVP